MTSNPGHTCILATRRSPLALAQARLAAAHLSARLPGVVCELLEMTTTGDQRLAWSLEKQGGKGLFTKELEHALLDGRADVAVHSAKDMPTELEPGLLLAGYLSRERAHDVLVLREGVVTPLVVATSSPRRRAQLVRRLQDVRWTEIRGNVETRLRKIAAGEADATVLAAAGLHRLGIASFPGVRFEALTLEQSVPAAGQGAIAIQCRAADVVRYAPLLCKETAAAVDLERRFLGMLGGGCHTAFAVHCAGGRLMAFHEATGYHELALGGMGEAELDAFARRVLGQ